VRVAFVTREYPPDTAWGGIATMYHSLARALAARGHEVHVVCQAVAGPGDAIDGGVFVHRVGTNPKRYSALARVNYSLHAWRRLLGIVRQYGVDVVEAAYWGAEGFLYGLRRRTPLVVRVATSAADIVSTGTYSGRSEWLALKLLSLLEDFAARRADRIVVTTEGLRAPLIARLGVSPDKVDLVRHAVDTGKFVRVESGMRARLGIPQDARMAIFVGRLEARKGVHVFCEAVPRILRRVPSAVFVLVGRDTDSAPAGGSMRSYVARRARDGGFEDRLVFVDTVTETELVELYSACDLLVSPSLHESFGLVVLEAMACGKPVVATSTGLVPELGLDGTGGIMVSPGDAEGLADAAARLLSLDDQGVSLAAERNRSLVETEFSIGRWVDDVIAVYERAVRERVGI
jgi:glycogen(starch) synthase